MLSITVPGGTLFDVAQKNLGDATRWEEIAQLNHIFDPWLDGLVTLLLPESLGQKGFLRAI